MMRRIRPDVIAAAKFEAAAISRAANEAASKIAAAKAVTGAKK